MLSSFVALIAIARLQEPPQVPTAGAVISKMLSRYSALTSLTGRIRLTVTTMNVSTSLDTTVQFEKPSYVLVKQESHGDPSGKWLIVSDGRHFSYNVPRNLPGPKDDRLLEAVNQSGVIQTYQDIFSAGAQGLKDRSMPLDIAFGRRLDLQYRRNQWASHAMLGKQELRGVAAYVVGGDWREYATAVVSGSYRMWITEAGDLIRYEESGVVALPDPGRAGAMSAQNVSSIWDVDLHPDVPTDHSLYVLP